MEEKKLYKIEDGKVIAGVCGGIAEFFGIDPTVVRVVWALCVGVLGTGLLAYIICALVIPKKSDVYPGGW